MIDTVLKLFGYPVVSLGPLLLGIPDFPKWRPRTHFVGAYKSASQIPQYRQKKSCSSVFIFDKVHWNRVFSHDVTAAILVSQNIETAAMLESQNIETAAMLESQSNETAAMFVSQTSPVGVELFSYAKASLCSDKFA